MINKDLSYLKFGRLLVICREGRDKQNKPLWKCQCDCESKTIVYRRAGNLNNGDSISCGCLKKPGPLEADERTKDKLLKNSIWVGECLEWQGYIPNKDVHYGMLYYPKTKKYHSVHRLSYLLFVGNIPDNMCILHSCDNNKCINPKHLRIGTKSDNSNDMVKRKRHPYLQKNKSENHHNAKLNKDQVKEIIKLREEGKTYKTISQLYSVHLSMIAYICTGKNWKE